MRWTIASILSEFPKDFLFRRAAHPRVDRTHRRARGTQTAPKHGYEDVSNLFQSLINTCAIVRVISSILGRIIDGLTVGVLQIGLRNKHVEVRYAPRT